MSGRHDTGRRRLRRPLSAEERVLWSTVTRDVVPLRPGAADRQDANEAATSRERPSVSPPVATTLGRAPALLPAQLDRRVRQRLARGHERIDARLDLHGLTQAQAHDMLARFLRAAVARDARVVLVITGKGAAGPGLRGVLKRQVPLWLGATELRALVAGFSTAHVTHGGEGALYVRLRRGVKG